MLRFSPLAGIRTPLTCSNMTSEALVRGKFQSPGGDSYSSDTDQIAFEFNRTQLGFSPLAGIRTPLTTVTGPNNFTDTFSFSPLAGIRTPLTFRGASRP